MTLNSQFLHSLVGLNVELKYDKKLTLFKQWSVCLVNSNLKHGPTDGKRNCDFICYGCL